MGDWLVTVGIVFGGIPAALFVGWAAHKVVGDDHKPRRKDRP